MKRVEDRQRSVVKTDAEHAQQVFDQLSGSDNPTQASYVEIDAPDDLVMAVAESVVGVDDYDVAPDILPGAGVNSNTAPTFIAVEATEIAGGKEFNVPEYGVFEFMPGTSPRYLNQVEHEPLPEPLKGDACDYQWEAACDNQ